MVIDTLFDKNRNDVLWILLTGVTNLGQQKEWYIWYASRIISKRDYKLLETKNIFDFMNTAK